MLPVQTKPPRRPGAWGSPFGKPRLIDLSAWTDPRRAGFGGIFPLPQGCWYVQCGPANHVQFTYNAPGTEPDPGDPHPWAMQIAQPYEEPANFNQPRPPAPLPPHPLPPPWPPLPPPPSNSVQQMELIQNGRSGAVFADGQNVTIEGMGIATIIDVFSA